MSIQAPMFIFIVYLSKVEAHASTGVYEFDIVWLIGQRVYKRVYGLHSLMKA